MTNLLKIYTPKQLEIYKRTLHEDWFMLINHGAKRSGKTVINNDLFLQELMRVRRQANIEGIETPMYILSGVTLTTIYQNILKELTNKYGIEFKFDRYNNFEMFGVYVVQVGHGTIAGLGKIRGMTAYGAYVNEGSLANETVFDEIKSRCSGYGARILVDTNPDQPEHWLRRDYILNNDESVISYKFTIHDNTFLNERYKNNIINTTPSGVFTDRNIWGNWVSGDGVIFADFDEKKHYVDDISHLQFKEYLAGVDWGYSHYGAIVVLGITFDNKYVVLEEYAEQFKEIDYWVDIAKDINKRYKNIPFWCDSARPEHVGRFKREGLKARNANKEVISGIESVAKLYKEDRLFLYRKTVNRFKDEVYMYIWNDKTGEPVKQFDDVQDAIRYAIHSRIRSKEKGIRSIDKNSLGFRR